MNKTIRFLIAIAFVLAIVVAASNNVAWAGPASEVRQGARLQEQASSDLGKPDPGTVKPPPAESKACQDGTYPVGGVAVLTVTDLAPGYCIVAFLRNHAFAVGHIPDEAGKILAPIMFLRIFHHGTLVYELPVEDGQVQLCYSLYPDRAVQMYFLDFYGPRFGKPKGQPSWEPLETSVDEVSACVPAQITGAYALIGK